MKFFVYETKETLKQVQTDYSIQAITRKNSDAFFVGASSTISFPDKETMSDIVNVHFPKSKEINQRSS